MVESVMDGFHSCIFAYGQTGSGKTFTMEGSEEQRGVNYRALDALFKLRDRRVAAAAARGEGGDKGRDGESYVVKMSNVEIYNEQVCHCHVTATSLLRYCHATATSLPRSTQV